MEKIEIRIRNCKILKEDGEEITSSYVKSRSCSGMRLLV